ncbi:MAG TPA: lysophospholipid acyltransferase family protein [Terriglobales bacterium]|nr:lysophospholipid acyltransferase family protein [Terriglobales bacterium]
MTSLRSALVWLVTWAYMTVAGVVCLPWVWLTGRLGFVYAAARLGLRLLLWLAGARVVVEGRELLPRQPGCIYMANHQSNLDPPILLANLPGYISFLAKQELFRVPVLGTVARIGGLVPVDRSKRTSAQASIARAAEAVRRGRPFMIFPEGTRSRDGQLLPFKKGPFYLAEQAGAPVVPITITGSGALMPKGQWKIRSGVVKLQIHAPLWPTPASEGDEGREALAAAVRAAISAAISQEATTSGGRPAGAGGDETRSGPHPNPR